MSGKKNNELRIKMGVAQKKTFRKVLKGLDHEIEIKGFDRNGSFRI